MQQAWSSASLHWGSRRKGDSIEHLLFYINWCRHKGKEKSLQLENCEKHITIINLHCLDQQRSTFMFLILLLTFILYTNLQIKHRRINHMYLLWAWHCKNYYTDDRNCRRKEQSDAEMKTMVINIFLKSGKKNYGYGTFGFALVFGQSMHLVYCYTIYCPQL